MLQLQLVVAKSILFYIISPENETEWTVRFTGIFCSIYKHHPRLARQIHFWGKHAVMSGVKLTSHRRSRDQNKNKEHARDGRERRQEPKSLCCFKWFPLFVLPDNARRSIPRPFQGRFLIGRVGLAMVNQCTKYKVSRFTRCEAMNGGVKCTNWGSWGRLWATQGHQQCHRSMEHIRLPIRL